MRKVWDEEKKDVAPLEWPFKITVDEDGTYRVSPIGIPNCEGIGRDIETARKAGSTALSFILNSAIPLSPDAYIRQPAGDLIEDGIIEIRIDRPNRAVQVNPRSRNKLLDVEDASL